MKQVLHWGILLAALSLAIPAAAGDWAHDREGFVIGFNMGGGTATASPKEGEDDSGGGGAGSFRLGWAGPSTTASCWASNRPPGLAKPMSMPT